MTTSSLGELAPSEPDQSTFVVNDVVEYAPGDGRWCREGTAIAVRIGDRIVLHDTYWKSGPGWYELTDRERASAQLLFNLDDYQEVPGEETWKRYSPDDRQVLTSQSGLQCTYLVRKGATEDLDTMIDNARQVLKDACDHVTVAQRLATAAQNTLIELLDRQAAAQAATQA